MGDIGWQVGNGESIKALNQPWYEEWAPQRVLNHKQRDATVNSLFDPINGCWVEREIREIMGAQAFQHIRESAQKPKQGAILPDKLIWKPSQKGQYSTKEGYEILSKQRMEIPVYSASQKHMWQKIWEWKRIIPRVKTFIWRAMHNGIPTMLALHTRIRSIQPQCPRCHSENEYTMHLLFFCPIAQAVWFASPLNLSVESLPLQFPDMLMVITKDLQEDQLVLFTNLLWGLWKARNEEVFQGKKSSPEEVLKKAKAMEMSPGMTPTGNGYKVPQSIMVPENSYIILYDGSWDQNHNAGMGVAIYNTMGELKHTHAGAFTANHPIEAEALALLWSLNYIQTKLVQGGTQKYICYGDCKTLVRAVRQNNIDEVPHWRAAEAVAQCAGVLQLVQQQVRLEQVPREAVKVAHRLANWARQSRNIFTGYPSISLRQQLQVEREVDEQMFTITSSQ